MASEELEAQIEKEAKEIDSAPKIPLSKLQPQMGTGGRCSFCGRISSDLVFVETVHGLDRYKGECCR